MDQKVRDFLHANCLFIAATRSGPDQIAFVTHYAPALRDGITLTQILFLEQLEKWRNGSRHKWACVGVASRNKSTGEIVLLGRDGEFAFGSDKELTEGVISNAKSSVGPTRGIRNVAGQILAYGMRRQIFRQDDTGRWSAFAPESKSDTPTARSASDRVQNLIADMAGLNALTGSSPTELYAVGTDGEIWRTEKDTWKQVDSPTNLMLTDATVAPDGMIYACGLSGILLRGRHDMWDVVNYEGPQGLDFRAVAWFKDYLYLADGHSVRRIVDGELMVVDFGVDGVVPAHFLYADSNFLLTLAGKEIYITFDGVTWTPILN